MCDANAEILDFSLSAAMALGLEGVQTMLVGQDNAFAGQLV